MSPLDARQFPDSPITKLIVNGYKLSNKYFAFKGLHQFKNKYEPEWEARYARFYGNPKSWLPTSRAVIKMLFR
jgi:lysylphosphatidylglycerol synthetase-like protein (DUF2156 family)